MNYKDLKIEEFLDKLSSSDSMPGGGVASALVAANGISLIMMVCNLSIGKEKYKENEQLIISSKEKCESLKKDFISLMDKDAENFKVMEEVFAMPKGTEEEKQMRKEAMQNACKKCCEVPKEIILKCLEGIEISNSLKNKTNTSAASDLEVGNILLIAAAGGAWDNIEINLKYIEDKQFVEKFNNIKKTLGY